VRVLAGATLVDKQIERKLIPETSWQTSPFNFSWCSLKLLQVCNDQLFIAPKAMARKKPETILSPNTHTLSTHKSIGGCKRSIPLSLSPCDWFHGSGPQLGQKKPGALVPGGSEGAWTAGFVCRSQADPIGRWWHACIAWQLAAAATCSSPGRGVGELSRSDVVTALTKHTTWLVYLSLAAASDRSAKDQITSGD